MPDRKPFTRRGLSRRDFLGSSGAVSATIGLSGARAEAQSREVEAGTGNLMTVTLTVNGQARTMSVEPRTTLVEALRDMLGLTGTKIGCNQGQCGACTVLLDGRRVNSCLTLAVAADGRRDRHVEGLADPGGDLHPMQAAFAEQDAFQCGYCTPGQILSAIACIDEGHAGRRGRDPRIHERQPLPLRRLSQHRRRGRSRARRAGGLSHAEFRISPPRQPVGRDRGGRGAEDAESSPAAPPWSI